jgi:cystathionine beta-lyase/cystathionine gamma-synthase
MTHASIPREDRIKNGLVDSLIRLSVGIEDADDLIEDLDNAIGKERSQSQTNTERKAVTV